MRHRPLVRALAQTLVAVLFAGCFSVHTVGRHPLEQGGETGGVSLRVFADDSARHQGAVGPRGLASELARQEKQVWSTVFRSLDPRWTVLNLAPGRYRLHFPARLDAEGNVVKLEERDQVFEVRAGEVTDVDATLEHVNRAAVAVGVVAAVAAAVLLHDWLDDHDLPLPPLPIPPPGLVDAVFYLTFDAGVGAGWQTSGAPAAPIATSHFPDDGATTSARRVRITFALTTPIPVARVNAGGVKVLGETSGLCEGTLDYDAAHGWLIWTPAEDLPRGDTFHVTLGTDAVEDAGGNALPAPMTFTFQTRP